MKSKRLILIVTATLALLVAAAWCVRKFGGWESVTVPLDSEFSLRVSRKASHPFLAEYDRKLTVIRSGRALGTLNYAKDTGGGFPMQVRFHADSTRRLVRVTDYLGDRLIDLHTGRYVDDQTPPEGKESSSAVRDATLPTLRRSVEIDRDMQVVQRDGAVMTVPPPALQRTRPSRSGCNRAPSWAGSLNLGRWCQGAGAV